MLAESVLSRLGPPAVLLRRKAPDNENACQHERSNRPPPSYLEHYAFQVLQIDACGPRRMLRDRFQRDGGMCESAGLACLFFLG